MFFFNDDDKAQGKKRSLFGRLFNPRLDRDVKPIGESFGMFVRIIASVFAAHRLFPKDHPALRDANVRLTLREVIAVAYGNLSFTKEGMPQVLLFGAVVASIAFGALFVVMLVLSIFTPSQAHAQVFVPPSGVTDWGLGIIDYIFKGETVTFDTVKGKQDCAFVQALGTALKFYSTAVLVLAGLLLLYHLTFMVAETAHTGKPMGRANQVWAPIRLVIAIGLLVPIAASTPAGGGAAGGCSVAGYNTGQYLAMQIGRWGSGLASQVWGVFLGGLNYGGVGCSTTSDPKAPSCAKEARDVTDFVQSLSRAAACGVIVEEYIRQIIPTGPGYLVTDITAIDLTDPGEHLIGLTGGEFYQLNSSVSKKICGSIVVPAIESNAYSSVSSAVALALNRQRWVIQSFVTPHAMEAVQNSGVTPTPNATRKAAFDALVASVQTVVDRELFTALTTTDATINTKVKAAFAGATTAGWMAAGGWFGGLSKFHFQRMEAIRGGFPSVKEPALLDEEAVATTEGGGGWKFWKDSKLHDVYSSAAKALLKYDAMMDFTEESGANRTGFGNMTAILFPDPSTKDMMAIIRGSVMNGLLGLIDKAGVAAHLWTAEGALSITFGSTSNPLGELAAFGQGFIYMVQWCLNVMAVLYALSLVPFFYTTAIGLAGIVGSFVSLFFMLGFTLAFLVPLYPFMRFFFGIVTWLMSLFEAVVSMPLFALAHVNPYGDGISGQQAQYGYAVLTQLLLRPVLMIFGLVAGFIIFSAALLLLNYAFGIAAAGTGGFTYGNSLALLAKLVYSVLYAALVVILANESFSTIGLFPQVAMSWIGKSRPQEEKFNPGLITAAATYMSGRMASQGMGGAAALMSAPGKALKNRRDDKERQEKEVDAARAAAGTTSYRQAVLEKMDQGRNLQGQQLEAQYEGNENTESTAASSRETADNTDVQVQQNADAQNTRRKIEKNTRDTKENTDRNP